MSLPAIRQSCADQPRSVYRIDDRVWSLHDHDETWRHYVTPVEGGEHLHVMGSLQLPTWTWHLVPHGATHPRDLIARGRLLMGSPGHGRTTPVADLLTGALHAVEDYRLGVAVRAITDSYRTSDEETKARELLTLATGRPLKALPIEATRRHVDRLSVRVGWPPEHVRALWSRDSDIPVWSRLGRRLVSAARRNGARVE